MSDELARIEAYYDSVPRATARVETVGPFTLFVATRGFPFYARPTLGGASPMTLGAIEEVRRRQRRLGVPEAFEWVDEVTPELAALARAAGLEVHRHPLLVLRSPVETELPAGYRLRTLEGDDPALPAVRAALNVGFSAPGTAVGTAGPAARNAAIEPDEVHRAIWDLMAAGLFVTVVVEDASGPVAAGSHLPRGEVSEVTGVATLPSLRRRGLAAAVTAALVADARAHGVELCFLSAESDDVARVYERVGFERLANACTAEPSDP